MAGAFELHVEPHRNNELKFTLLECRIQRRGRAESKPKELVAIWGAPVCFAQEVILTVLRKAGVTRGITSLRAGDVVDLNEAVGARLAVQFLAIKPLRKLERVRAAAEEIVQMSPEATFFWLTKIAGGQDYRTRQRHLRALRLLLAEE